MKTAELCDLFVSLSHCLSVVSQGEICQHLHDSYCCPAHCLYLAKTAELCDLFVSLSHCLSVVSQECQGQQKFISILMTAVASTVQNKMINHHLTQKVT